MKNILKAIEKVLYYIYGIGIACALFIGGLSAFGYIAALIIGGETAAAICNFIHKGVYPVLIYGSSIVVLIGLVKLYISGEHGLTSGKNKAKKNQ